VATGGVRANGEGQGQLTVPVSLREQNRDLGLPPGKTKRNCKLTRVLSLPLDRDEPNENRPSGPEEIHLQTMHVQGETLARSLGGGLAQVPVVDSRFTRYFGQATGELCSVSAVTQQVLQGPILVQELTISGQAGAKAPGNTVTGGNLSHRRTAGADPGCAGLYHMAPSEVTGPRWVKRVM
jgi:hypothetical protein